MAFMNGLAGGAGSLAGSGVGVAGSAVGGVAPSVNNLASSLPIVGGMFSQATGPGYQAGGQQLMGDQAGAQAATNAQLAQQQQFVNALGAQGGMANQADVYNQLKGIAAGTGPNPAQAALANATQGNVANQAALMAGQRGASANAGLIARQAAQQGAATQQQSAGQAAALQAQQSLGAINAMGGIANQQVAMQQAAQNQLSQNQLANQQQIMGGNVGLQSSINNAQSGYEGRKLAGSQSLIGGLLGGAGAGAVSGGSTPAAPAQSPSGWQQVAKGGVIKGYADGGEIQSFPMAMQPMQGAAPMDPMGSPSGPQSYLGQFLSGGIAPANNDPAPEGTTSLDKAMQVGKLAAAALAKGGKVKGGKVPVMVSPGERYLSKDKAEEVAKGKADPIKSGSKVPGKASVAGDSYENDTVPAELEKGGVVIPRSVLESKDPHKAAAKFVAAALAKHRAMKK